MPHPLTGRPPARAAVLAAGVLVLTLGAPGAAARASTGTSGTTVRLGGTPLTDVSTDPAVPTPLTAGLWSDRVGGAGGAPHQLSYRRTMADSLVHVGVVGAPPTDDSARLGLEVVADDGTVCGTATPSSDFAVPRAAFGASVVAGPADPEDRDSPCGRSAELLISLEGELADDVDDGLPVAIRIVEEAPATAPTTDDDPADAGADDDEGELRSVTPGEAIPLAGSTGVLDAPELDDSGTWSDDVAMGEQRLYRVRLERGDSLAARVDVPSQDTAAREVLDFVSPSVVLTFTDPTRAVLGGVATDATSSTSYRDDEPGLAEDSLPPVSWTRAFDDDPASLPGDYWIGVAVGRSGLPTDSEGVTVPVELTVEVDRAADDSPSVPTYPEVVTGPGGTSGPEGYDAGTPYLVADGEFADLVTADPRSAGGGTRSLVRTVGGAALGVVSLGFLAAGVVVLRRGARAR